MRPLLVLDAEVGLLSKHRCLILPEGFYEWQTGTDGRKQPIRFSLADGQPFAFAGLYTTWHDPARDEPVVSCTIITTRANELVAGIHDRMPVTLPSSAEALWLSPEVEKHEALALLEPYPAELMFASPASTLVNSVWNDGPELLDSNVGTIAA